MTMKVLTKKRKMALVNAATSWCRAGPYEYAALGCCARDSTTEYSEKDSAVVENSVWKEQEVSVGERRARPKRKRRRV